MKNKKALWAVLAVALIAAVYVLVFRPFTPAGDGTITVKVTDTEQKVIREQELAYKTGDKLIDLVKDNFDNVLFDNGMLMRIESLDTPADGSEYIAILKNGEMADSGLETLQYEDGDVIEFRMTVYEYAEK